MPNFVYKVRDKLGKNLITGHAEAKDNDSLIADLQGKGYIVVEVKPDSRPKLEKDLAEIKVPRIKGRKFHDRIALDDLGLFTRQLATLLEAGVTLLRGLEIIQEQLSSRKLYVIIEKVKTDISSGLTFRDALARHPRVFSEFWVNVIETGEASGHLSAALIHMAKYLEGKAKLQRKILSALMYPIVLAVVMVAVLSVFLLKIVPIFSNLYGGLKVNLPWLTQQVIHLSHFLSRYFLAIVISLAALCFLFYRYIHTRQGRWNFDKFILKVPVVGTLAHQTAISRFTSGLSTLIQSGVPILFALDIVSKSAGNKVIEKAIEDVRTNVKEGKNMAEPLKKSGYFPPIVVQMVNVGEEVGELGQMLEKIYIYYEERISTSLERLSALFEPIMLVLMGIVIGTLVVSMYLPIFNLASTVR